MSTPPDDASAVPGWPVIRIVLARDPRSGQPELTVEGAPVDVPPGVNPRALAVEMVAEEAQRLGRPVRALAVDEDGSWPLIVHPDGSTGHTPATSAPRRRPPQTDRARTHGATGPGTGRAHHRHRRPGAAARPGRRRRRSHHDRDPDP